MTFPTEFPEVRGHMDNLVTLLEAITYLSEDVGGGGIHPVLDPKQAIEFKDYVAPAVIIVSTGSTLGSAESERQNGVLFKEYLHFDITAINASFDVEGSGGLEGQVTGDPGAAVLITDIRKAMYGQRYYTESVWANNGLHQSIVYPASPPFKMWWNDMNPNKVFHTLRIRCSWAIMA